MEDQDLPPLSSIAASRGGGIITDLQTSIRALVNERRELQNRLSNQKRWPSTRGTGPNNLRAIDHSRLKRDRTIDNITPEAIVCPTYPVEKRPKVALDDSTIRRTKNIFGSLLGHLQKAKSRLDDEKSLKAAELQRVVSEQVTQKLELERKNLAELRRRDFQERYQLDVQRMKELQRELQMKEAEMLKHFTHMKNFIRTDATPMIFWLPAKHNDVSHQLQDNTQTQIEAKIGSLATKFTNIVEERWGSVAELRTESADFAVAAAAAADYDEMMKSGPAVHPDLINDDDDDDSDEEVIMQMSSSKKQSSQDMRPDEGKLESKEIVKKEGIKS